MELFVFVSWSLCGKQSCKDSESQSTGEFLTGAWRFSVFATDYIDFQYLLNKTGWGEEVRLLVKVELLRPGILRRYDFHGKTLLLRLPWLAVETTPTTAKSAFTDWRSNRRRSVLQW